jgi:hypothetical protein
MKINQKFSFFSISVLREILCHLKPISIICGKGGSPLFQLFSCITLYRRIVKHYRTALPPQRQDSTWRKTSAIASSGLAPVASK